MQNKRALAVVSIILAFLILIINYRIVLQENPVYYKTVVNDNGCSSSFDWLKSHYIDKFLQRFLKTENSRNSSDVMTSLQKLFRDETLHKKMENMEKTIIEMKEIMIKNLTKSLNKIRTDIFQRSQRPEIKQRDIISVRDQNLLSVSGKINPLPNISLDRIAIRTNYRYNSPSVYDISKLNTTQLKLLDQSTDPTNRSATCESEVYLLVLVASLPHNYVRRKLIRNTWAESYMNDSKILPKLKKFQNKTFSPDKTFRVLFVMGKSPSKRDMEAVYEESEMYKDIVFGNNIEHYKNLTLKTRLALKWAYYDCKSAYVMKADDDVFVNSVPLVEWLKDKSLSKFYTGHCKINSPVIRNQRHKWFVSREDYSKDRYPRYCSGGGYLLSRDVLGNILKASYGRKYFPMEDLYVGLLVNGLQNVKVRDERRHFHVLFLGVTNNCEMNDIFLAHRVLGNNLKNVSAISRKAIANCKHNYW